MNELFTRKWLMPPSSSKMNYRSESRSRASLSWIIDTRRPKRNLRSKVELKRSNFQVKSRFASIAIECYQLLDNRAHFKHRISMFPEQQVERKISIKWKNNSAKYHSTSITIDSLVSSSRKKKVFLRSSEAERRAEK